MSISACKQKHMLSRAFYQKKKKKKKKKTINFQGDMHFIQETGTFQSAFLFTNTISDPMTVTLHYLLNHTFCNAKNVLHTEPYFL